MSLPLRKTTYLSAQLRESAPYLKEAGWRQTASLIDAAADELERLEHRLRELEAISPPDSRRAVS